jgi:anaerobic magnesium-protoporphyrin IX monomethyl ester cyclase
MKVLLINPPATHIIRESLPPVVEDSTGVYPPLGLLYVAAYAENVPGCEVEVLDCQAQGVEHETLGGKIAASGPDVVGVQAMTFTLIDAILVAGTVRRVLPEAVVIFGGPHPTLFPAETVSLPEVDAIVVGEGEYPFEGLLRALQSGKDIGSVSGVITKSNASSVADLRLEYIKDLDDLKMPARHLLNMSLYTSPLAAHRRVTTMMSSRGCPARCIFCDRPQMGKVFRKRSAAKVVEEMTYCAVEHGIGEIVFYDDTFTIDKKRILDICDLLIEQRLDVVWDIRARVDTITPEMLPRLRRAGCARIHYGVETGNPRLQKLLRKNLDLNKVREIFRLTHKEGIETLGYFMIGLPTETEEEIRETLDFMNSLPMDYAHVALFTPYPGTEIYRKALEDGFYDHDYWREFSLNPKSDFTPRYWNENFSDQDLLMILKRSYARFYRRPSYIFQRLLKVKSIDELWRKGILGLKLLKEVMAS